MGPLPSGNGGSIAHVQVDSVKISDLINGTGLNGPVKLNSTTVFNDTDADVMTGSAGSDWFLFDGTRDRVTDLRDEAFLNDLTFING